MFHHDSDRPRPAGGGGLHYPADGGAPVHAVQLSGLRPDPRERFAGCELVELERRFGDVRVSFLLPRGILEPIGWNSRGMATRKWFLTLTELVYEYDHPKRPAGVDPYRLRIPAGYAFDGASIPRKLWGREGFAPVEVHMWAALPHDYVCDHPEILPRLAGDAIFGHVLDQLALEHQLEVRQAIEFHSAVSIYSRLKQYFGISA